MKDKSNPEVLGPRDAMLMRLNQIHDAGGHTDEGTLIITFSGYVSGIP